MSLVKMQIKSSEKRGLFVEKLLIVDGSNLLFQMFYGMPAKIPGAHGGSVHGTLGFLGALLKILRLLRPTHALVVFDGECETARRELDPDYKANRPDYSGIPEEDTPFSQLPDIFRVLDHLHIPWKETENCEADDWIAGFARRYGKEKEIIIVSQDSDFFQLITDRVRVLRYRGERSVLYGPEEIQQKLGICPRQYAAYKSLTGDTADNIRGAEKVGPKTAASLMNRFGTLEALLEGWQEIDKPSVRESVHRNTERIRRNFSLIYLEGAGELPYAWEELSIPLPEVTTMQVLRALEIR